MLYANGKGRYDREYAELWRTLVPSSGQAATVQGELVRVIGRLADEAYRNGNGNWDYGYRSFISYLGTHLQDPASFDQLTLALIRRDLKHIVDAGTKPHLLSFTQGEDAYDRLTDRVVEWCQQHPVPIPQARNPTLHR